MKRFNAKFHKPIFLYKYLYIVYIRQYIILLRCCNVEYVFIVGIV